MGGGTSVIHPLRIMYLILDLSCNQSNNVRFSAACMRVETKHDRGKRQMAAINDFGEANMIIQVLKQRRLVKDHVWSQRETKAKAEAFRWVEKDRSSSEFESASESDKGGRRENKL